MSRPIFYVCNRDRVPEFAIQTSILAKPHMKVVVKESLTSAANPHINRMAETYKAIEKIGLGLDLVPAKVLFDGAVEFPFINGRIAENLLVEAIISGDEKSALAILRKVKSLIDKLPASGSGSSARESYEAVFGDSYSDQGPASRLGLVDLNLDNFIIDKNGGWHLFDYEWCFDFAVPKSFLFERILLWFFLMRYCQLILIHSAKYPVIQLGEGIFVPKYIYDKYQKHFLNLNEAMKAESYFQGYVHLSVPIKREGSWNAFDIKLLEAPSVPDKAVLEAAIREQSFIGRMDFINRQFTIALKVNRELESQLDSIKLSKAYKLARQMQKTKDNLKLKR